MKILLTGGSGDLGTILAAKLIKRGDTVVRFDIRDADACGEFISGSILDREKLKAILPGVDCIVHIAAWHGIHEFTKQKDAYDFWDVNVTGTFNIFQCALAAKVKNVLFISSEAVADENGIYGWTKVLGEEIAERYVRHDHMNVLTLRPRAFIPYWNKEVYQTYLDWCKWYWKGAVHIDDMVQATLQSIDLLTSKTIGQHMVLPVDGAYQYTQDDLQDWDSTGEGATFKKYYAKYYDLAVRHGLNPASPPTIQDISATNKILGYEPRYSLQNMLEDLAKYGESGPAARSE